MRVECNYRSQDHRSSDDLRGGKALPEPYPRDQAGQHGLEGCGYGGALGPDALNAPHEQQEGNQGSADAHERDARQVLGIEDISRKPLGELKRQPETAGDEKAPKEGGKTVGTLPSARSGPCRW